MGNPTRQQIAADIAARFDAIISAPAAPAPEFATPRTFPWRALLSLVGTVLAIGGGIICVSTPAAGGVCFGFGLLALLGASVE